MTGTVDSEVPRAANAAEANEHLDELADARARELAHVDAEASKHSNVEAGQHPDTAEHNEERDPPERRERHEAAERDRVAERVERREHDEEAEPLGSLTELLEKVGRDMSTLGVREAQLRAARNMPEVRRAIRDAVGALIVVVALLAAFVFLNVAAFDGLTRVMAPWLAGLVLAAIWLLVAGCLLFGVLERTRRWLLWIAFTSPPKEALEEFEARRDEAAETARDTMERLGPAIAVQIAAAAIPSAGDFASGVVDAGDSLIEASDELVEGIVDDLPGGGVVSQVWDVVLIPGRFGMRVATTVLGRGRPKG